MGKKELFAVGHFVNAKGLEKREWYWRVPQEVRPDLDGAVEIMGRKKFLMLVSDRREYYRLAQFEGFSRKLPVGELPAGIVHSSVRDKSDHPKTMLDFAADISKEQEDQIVQKIATLHLPKLQLKPHSLPK